MSEGGPKIPSTSDAIKGMESAASRVEATQQNAAAPTANEPQPLSPDAASAVMRPLRPDEPSDEILGRVDNILMRDSGGPPELHFLDTQGTVIFKLPYTDENRRLYFDPVSDRHLDGAALVAYRNADRQDGSASATIPSSSFTPESIRKAKGLYRSDVHRLRDQLSEKEFKNAMRLISRVQTSEDLSDVYQHIKSLREIVESRNQGDVIPTSASTPSEPSVDLVEDAIVSDVTTSPPATADVDAKPASKKPSSQSMHATSNSAIPLDNAILKGIQEDIARLKGLWQGQSISGEPDDINDLKHQIAKVRLENELAGLKPKKSESQVDPDTGSLAQWEFAESPRFSERGERINAALRARNEVIGSEARKLNGAKYFYEVAERWKKFPLWGKLGISLGIVGAGILGAVTAPATSIISSFALLSGLTWRVASAIGASAAMGTGVYTYMKKRNSRHPLLWATLAAIGTGATVIGGKYIAEYLMSASEAPNIAEVPKGTPAVHWNGGPETLVGTGAFAGGDLDSAIGQYVLQPDGPLRDFNLSPQAEAELQVGLKMAIVNGNPEIAQAFLGRVPEAVMEEGTSGIQDAVLRPGDVIRWNALGNPAFASKIEDYLIGASNQYGGGNLIRELEDKGGVGGLLARFQEIFAKK